MARIKKNDIVKIIAGKHKGSTGAVVAVLPKKNAVLVENIGKDSRKVRPSQINPRGGIKDIHVQNSDGATVRVARQLNDKEIS